MSKLKSRSSPIFEHFSNEKKCLHCTKGYTTTGNSVLFDHLQKLHPTIWKKFTSKHPEYANKKRKSRPDTVETVTPVTEPKRNQGQLTECSRSVVGRN